MRGLSWHHSGPLPPGDALDAGHTDARRHLRLSSLAASHHYGWLTPLLAAATAARETAAPRVGSRHGPSIPPPSPASEAAIAWRSPSRWSAAAATTAGVSWHAANRNCNTRDTTPTVGVSRPRLCRASSHAVRPPRHAGGY